MLRLYCTAFGFISKNEEYNSEENIPNNSYTINLILQKVVKQQKIINLNVMIIHFCFQCAQMMMNKILTSGGLTVKKCLKTNNVFLFRAAALIFFI